MRCTHMSGAGNDFMVIDARGLELNFQELAMKLCAMTGADGFMAVDCSENADFKLHFYNSDGSRANLCGNGSRCICRYAYDNGIAPETMTVETDAGIVSGWRLSDDQYRVKLAAPDVIDLQRKPGVDYVQCGVPHGLVELPDLSWEQKEVLLPRAVALRHDPAFPTGANINFYRWLGDAQVRVLTFERGVEDYTLACGTGCASLAAALYMAGKLPGKELTAHNPGGILKMTVEVQQQTITGLYQQGPAVYLQEYEV